MNRIMDGARRLLEYLGVVTRPNLMYIGGSDILPAPLERDLERDALERMAEGDESARAELIEHNLRLVVYIARRFENTGINIEDLISIGTIGLIKAINTFRLDKNIKLATYASRCIENEILMHLRKCAREKTEVSLDEPLNTDWDGNELLRYRNIGLLCRLRGQSGVGSRHAGRRRLYFPSRWRMAAKGCFFSMRGPA